MRRDTIKHMPSPLSFVETVQSSTLSNGVRVVTERVDSVQSASVGIWVATGSRDEEMERRGIAHFLEHMLFKGTERRPAAKDIADAMDNVGGDMNAFTDKEYTCYYARVLSEDVPLALDVLSDMYRHSRFDPEETARERKVVLEEIKERDDAPDDLVHDLFAETLYPDHPLGRPVIGTSETVSALEPDDLRAYMAKRYGPGAVVVTVAGTPGYHITYSFHELINFSITFLYNPNLSYLLIHPYALNPPPTPSISLPNKNFQLLTVIIIFYLSPPNHPTISQLIYSSISFIQFLSLISHFTYYFHPPSPYSPITPFQLSTTTP
jgi:hypothetical protein